MTPLPTPVLELRNISKRFGAVHSLENVSLALYPGEILGLLGDNGAGKSTLIKTISGFHAPTSGDLLIDGQPARLDSPRAARRLGIETVYQDFGLVEELSIARNFFLGVEPTRAGFLLKHREMNRIARQALGETGIRVRDPRDPVRNLSGGERQAIAIGRAWYFGSRVLILDEPTSALSIQETQKVFQYMREARAKRMAVVLITHNLSHAQEICDRFVILHHGKKAGELPSGTPPEKLALAVTQGRIT